MHLYRRLAAGLSSAEPAEVDALEDEPNVHGVAAAIQAAMARCCSPA